MKTKYSKYFKLGGLWNLTIGLWMIWAYFCAPKSLLFINAADITDGYYFLITCLSILFFGIGYAVTGFNYDFGKIMSMLGSAGKIMLFLIVLVCYKNDMIGKGWVYIGAGDFTWSVMFLIMINKIENGKVEFYS